MAKKSPAIPQEVQDAALASLAAFNRSNQVEFVLVFRGRFAYLSRIGNVRKGGFLTKIWNDTVKFSTESAAIETKIGRLEWTDENWEFAPYLYSREAYDLRPGAYLYMPGGEFLNGTIEGALRAGMHLYP